MDSKSGETMATPGVTVLKSTPIFIAKWPATSSPYFAVSTSLPLSLTSFKFLLDGMSTDVRGRGWPNGYTPNTLILGLLTVGL